MSREWRCTLSRCRLPAVENKIEKCDRYQKLPCGSKTETQFEHFFIFGGKWWTLDEYFKLWPDPLLPVFMLSSPSPYSSAFPWLSPSQKERCIFNRMKSCFNESWTERYEKRTLTTLYDLNVALCSLGCSVVILNVSIDSVIYLTPHSAIMCDAVQPHRINTFSIQRICSTGRNKGWLYARCTCLFVSDCLAHATNGLKPVRSHELIVTVMFFHMHAWCVPVTPPNSPADAWGALYSAWFHPFSPLWDILINLLCWDWSRGVGCSCIDKDHLEMG